MFVHVLPLIVTNKKNWKNLYFRCDSCYEAT